MARFADTALACGCVHPGEEGQDGAGMTGLVAKVKVISRWIVEVDGLLDKTQPEVARIKPQVLDWITADCGHMMDAWHGCLLMPNAWGDIRNTFGLPRTRRQWCRWRGKHTW